MKIFIVVLFFILLFILRIVLIRLLFKQSYEVSVVSEVMKTSTTNPGSFLIFIKLPLLNIISSDKGHISKSTRERPSSTVTPIPELPIFTATPRKRPSTKVLVCTEVITSPFS